MAASPSDYPFDVGAWTRRVSTVDDAQVWFDRGLNWLYGYNHEEAVVCFRNTLEHDATCAMAWWGIAYGAGPFYNRPWIRHSDEEIKTVVPICFDAAQSAQALVHLCRETDRALINALALRYQARDETNREVLDRWHREFTDAMRDVHEAWPDDLDVAALFAEAAVTCTPRQLWDLQTGLPKSTALTAEALAVLERGMRTIEQTGVVNPGIPHMMIHALEMSPFPERALPASDLLRSYAPDTGHLVHMPAHIYVLCGDYAQSVEQSRRAVIADDRYLAYAGDSNFYSTSRCHDLHLYMYTAMFLGQYRTALHAADRICESATQELIDASAPFMASILDGYSAMRTHVLVRFGKWQELTREPVPPVPEKTPIRFALHAYGKAVGHANLGEFDEAMCAQKQFLKVRDSFPEDAIFCSNPVVNMLAVGQAMLEGELAYHQGDYDTAFRNLRLAVKRDDSLNYTEPWAWMHPPRHALGALLLAQGHVEEAEAVYRVDLGIGTHLAKGVPRCCSHPDNIWSLHGLLECIRNSADPGEVQVLQQRLDFAQARTDVPITASCYCRKM